MCQLTIRPHLLSVAIKAVSDLCSDGGYGEDINRNHVNDTMIMTATLNSIVFQAKEVLKPMPLLKITEDIRTQTFCKSVFLFSSTLTPLTNISTAAKIDDD